MNLVYSRQQWCINLIHALRNWSGEPLYFSVHPIHKTRKGGYTRYYKMIKINVSNIFAHVNILANGKYSKNN